MPLSSAPPDLEFGVGVWSLENTYEFPRSWHALYAGVRRLAQHAEALDFASFWFAEHHHVYSGYLPSQFPIMAACAAVTERIRLCGGVTLLPLNGAQRIVEGSAALQALAPGRLRLAFGLGYIDREFQAAGLKRKDRARLLEKYLTQLLTTDADRIGDTELWVGGHVDAAIRRAARFGRSVFLQQIYDAAELRRLRNLWERDLKLFKPGDTPRIGLLSTIWAHKDRRSQERARDRVDSTLTHYMHHVWGSLADGQAVGMTEPQQTYLIGSPQMVVDNLAPLITKGGADALFFFIQTPNADDDEVAEQMDILASEVVPHLRGLR